MNRILIIDDTKININMIINILGDDYDILVAINGQDALNLLEKESVDLILLDIMMPDMDGYEVCTRLKKNQKIKDIPVIFITAKTDEDSIETAYDVGGSDYVTKPFKAKDFITLLTKTHEACTLKRSQQIESNKQLNNDLASSINLAPNTETITIEDLKLAIRRHELIIHYQPQIWFDDNRLQGAEIIMKWQHPSKGLILPEQFIPLAEEHRLMNLLTEEILMLAIKDHKKITENQLDIKVAINLSAQNISDLSMPEKLEALVKSNNIDPEFFSLEITESALMNGVSESLDILNRLRMKGFLLSIDDFGTGHSSLVTLYQAPFTELKIDQQFVKHITMDNDAAAIVKICILLAKELNMHCVAESVETQETWDKLKELGCDIAQGDFVAPPMPIDNFIDWVGKRNH